MKIFGKVSRFLFVVLFPVMAWANGAEDASDHYYMITFGVQNAVNSFTRAHTFALFVKESNSKLETKVISWLPKSKIVCIFCSEEQGRNFPLDESLSDPANDGRRITAWGPFEIQKELYVRASKQQEKLESGEVLYKAKDEPLRFTGRVTNCEHAVSDMDIDSGYLNTGLKHGNAGTRAVTRHLFRWVVTPHANLDYLFRPLGLDKYPIRREDL